MTRHTVEIITIGDEILIGQIVDTNSAWMAAQLNLAGLKVAKITSVQDDADEIRKALRQAEKNVRIILLTGGLGPTNDDITKQTLAEYFDCGRMLIHQPTLEFIAERFAKRGIAMNELNRRQAEVPDCCTVIANDDGTAPGMWFEKNGIIAVSMPGVPSEMKLMFPKVLQRLKQRFTLPVISHRTLMTYGIPESELALQIAGWEQSLPSGMSLAYLPEVGTGIKLRLSCSGRDAEVNALIESRFDQLKALLGDAVYGYEPDTLESVVGKLLTAKNATAATAESCTGGLIAKRITSVAGSSQYFKGGVVAYTNEIKTGLIGVDAAVIERFNAVSTEVAELMAAGARRALNVDYAVATTGIAGPSGALPDKPVGLCCFGIASPRGTKSFQKIFTSDRTGNIASAAAAALNALRLELL